MADLSRFDLTGRIALVTGAAEGIGFALAGGLGRAGASLVLNDIDLPRLERAVGELRREGLTVEGRVFDVRDAEQVEVRSKSSSTTRGSSAARPLRMSRPSRGARSSTLTSPGSSWWARLSPAG
jgi:NAD(P)-dependent dehydrogenase (short-subunit alcohol dehydrogenase family)